MTVQAGNEAATETNDDVNEVEDEDAGNETEPIWNDPVKAQAEIEKLRKENAKRRVDAKKVKEASEELEKLRQASLTDQEKLIEEAEKRGEQKVLAKATERLVRLEFKAAIGGRLDSKEIDAILEALDHNKFLDDEGNVNSKKVEELANRVAPAKGRVDLGQGRRGGSAQPRNMNDVIREAAGYSR